MQNNLIAIPWSDYTLLDFGDGKRLEKVGSFTLVRPDPEALGQPINPSAWSGADAQFTDSWKFKKPLPDIWPIRFEELTFNAYCAPFKHIGFFPEQSAHWLWMRDKIRSAGVPPKVLNLFGYTGVATLVAAQAGAQVTHIDSAKKAIAQARANQLLSGLADAPIRWICEDALTFVQREARRGNYYDAIIMDPPAYGHGPDGQVWDFKKDFPELLAACQKILSKNPLFVLVNAYAIGEKSFYLQKSIQHLAEGQKTIEHGELLLQSADGRQLSTGIYARMA